MTLFLSSNKKTLIILSMLRRAAGKTNLSCLHPLQIPTGSSHLLPCQSEYFNSSISLSRRIWQDMDTIQHCFQSILCSERMHQSTFAKRGDKVSFSAWAYLGRRSDGIAGVTSTGHDSVTVRADLKLEPPCKQLQSAGN
jgi:hypothetical protein